MMQRCCKMLQTPQFTLFYYVYAAAAAATLGQMSKAKRAAILEADAGVPLSMHVHRHVLTVLLVVIGRQNLYNFRSWKKLQRPQGVQSHPLFRLR